MRGVHSKAKSVVLITCFVFFSARRFETSQASGKTELVGSGRAEFRKWIGRVWNKQRSLDRATINNFTSACQSESRATNAQQATHREAMLQNRLPRSQAKAILPDRWVLHRQIHQHGAFCQAEVSTTKALASNTALYAPFGKVLHQTSAQECIL